MSSRLLQPESQEPEIRIVFIGKTGVGKTSTLNLLMGRPGLTKPSASSKTTECKTEERQFKGRKLVVMDTPGLMNTKKTREEVEKDLVGCITLAAPGPHVFLFVLKPEPQSKYDRAAVEIFQEIFGDAKRFTLALFTCRDKYEPKEAEIPENIRDITAGHRSLDNKPNTHHIDQVDELLEKIVDMVEANNGQHYTNDMLRKAQEAKERVMRTSTPEAGGTLEDVVRQTSLRIITGTAGKELGGRVKQSVDFVMRKFAGFITKWS